MAGHDTSVPRTAAARISQQRPGSSEASDAGPPAEVIELDAGSLVALHAVSLLGGYAPDASLRIGELYDLRFLDDRMVLYTSRLPEVLMEIPYADAEVVDIGGPGLVKSGGGFAGGGFGAVGALEGMAIAGVLNALTPRTTTTTVIRIQARASELFLLHTKQTPQQLRMRLSRPLGAIRAVRAAGVQQQPAGAASPVQELAKLASMLESGLLTRAEFDALKARLLSQARLP
ncbi:MAG: SHOCT domain-containing protein [Actinomycetota bacterium]|nr:SHOCT domain-containing protein [Actinomycetota bacterium]